MARTTIFSVLTLPEMSQLFEDEHPLVRSCRALNELRLAEDLTDVTIEVQDGARLYAHRLMLAARIPALRAPANGSLGKKTTLLRWPNVPRSVATALIQYAYTGQVKFTQENARGIVAVARMVELPVLEHWAEKFLVNNLSTEYVETTWNLAKSLNSRPLIDACLRQMTVHFEGFVYSDVLVRLPADSVLTVLRSGNLEVSSEEQIFCAISRWVSACKERGENYSYLPAMLKEIQWDQTTAQFRQHLLVSHHIFQESIECSRLMALIENWIGAPKHVHTPCPFNQRRRQLQSFFVFGRDKDENRWSVLQFDSRLENEQRIADMEERQYATYSVVGGSIFAVGGSTQQQWGLTSVKEFVVRERRWRPRAPLTSRRQQHAAAIVWVAAAATNGQEGGEKALIGVFGGGFTKGNTSTQLASGELYDVSQNRWHALPDLPEKRLGPAAACLSGDSRIFIFGGNDGSSFLDSVVFCQLRADWQEKVSTTSSAQFWMPAAGMRNARCKHAAVPFRGKILVAGGKNPTGDVNVVEIFSPPDANCKLGQWTQVAGMQQPRRCFYLLTSGEAVFALSNVDKPWNTVEAFTTPEGLADMGNDFASWIWSAKSPVETLVLIRGAASVRL